MHGQDVFSIAPNVFFIETPGFRNWLEICHILNERAIVMSKRVKDEPPDLANQLLVYLTDNPDAQDTLEGIIEWWLVQQRIEYEMGRVKDALSWLVSSGFVIESKARDTRVFYRVNKGKIEEIEKLIKCASK